MRCSVPTCERPGAWPGERYCLRHYFVPRARRVRSGSERETPWAGWPQRFHLFGRGR